MDATATRHPLGLILATKPPLTDGLHAYATAALPAPPPDVPVPAVTDWQMADNDRLGCCVMSGEVHELMAWAAILGLDFAYPGDQAVQDAYFTLTGGGDTGLLIQNALEDFRTVGRFGHKIVAHAPVVPTNSTAIREAVAWYGLAKVGVQLPMPAQEQFQAGQTWDLTGSQDDYDIEGGHDIEYVAYNAEGPIAITWGRPQQITWRWHFTYATEAHAIVPDDYENLPAGKLPIDVSALVADLPSV